MKLKETNWLGRYYNWIYSEYTNDLCTFFWGTLLALLFAFILIPGRLLRNEYDDTSDTYSKGLVCWLVCWGVFAIVVLTGSIPYNKEYFNSLNPFIALFLLLGTGILIWGTIVGGCWGIVYIVERRREKNYYKEYKPSLLSKTSDVIGAIRGKYCTKIDWEK